MVGNFEGKEVFRISYTTKERVRDGEVEKQAMGFFLASTPEEAVRTLREWVAPQEAWVGAVEAVIPGENIRFPITPVVN